VYVPEDWRIYLTPATSSFHPPNKESGMIGSSISVSSAKILAKSFSLRKAATNLEPNEKGTTRSFPFSSTYLILPFFVSWFIVKNAEDKMCQLGAIH
jgi:hypothetical protein